MQPRIDKENAPKVVNKIAARHFGAHPSNEQTLTKVGEW